MQTHLFVCCKYLFSHISHSSVIFGRVAIALPEIVEELLLQRSFTFQEVADVSLPFLPLSLVFARE